MAGESESGEGKPFDSLIPEPCGNHYHHNSQRVTTDGMRGKRGRVAEADVGTAGDIEDLELLPSSGAAKGPKPTIRNNATASKSIFALVALMVIAIFLVATESTQVEKRSVPLPTVEKRLLVDVMQNVTFGSLLPDGVPVTAQAPVPVAQVPVVQPVVAEAAVDDGPLPGECERSCSSTFGRRRIACRRPESPSTLSSPL